MSVRLQDLPPSPALPSRTIAEPPLLVRPRLHRLLDTARDGLVWISGPTGAGKTSLMRTWTDARRASGTPCLWMQLDATDAVPAAFFRRLRQALLATLPTPAARRALRLPVWRDAPGPGGLADFAPRYFRAWAAALPQPLVLVFDACQAAGTDSAWPSLLDQLLQALGPGTPVLAASTDPLPLALHRWAAGGHCLRLGWEDLRADEAEVQELALAWHLPAADEEWTRLAGGWMAAWVEIFRAGAAGAPAPAPQRVFESCAGAAFAALDPLMRQMLVAVSAPPTANAQEAQRLSGLEQAGEMLAALWRQRWFVERQLSFDGEVRYALHPMLRAYAAERRVTQRVA